jgi:hypothetical protein
MSLVPMPTSSFLAAFWEAPCFRTRANGHSGNHPRVAVTDGAVGLEHALPQLAGWPGLVNEISPHAGQD